MLALEMSLGMASIGYSQSIWQGWVDRRPIGQEILADPSKQTASNPNGWWDGGPGTVGISQFQADVLAREKKTAQSIVAANGQGVIIWDITGTGQGNQYLGDPRYLSPVYAGLRVPVALRKGVEPAMNAIADRVFSTYRNLGLTVGICIRAQQVVFNSSGRLTGVVEYDTTPHQLADLDAKITYAHNRWGCRIFYVDSNQAAGDIWPFNSQYRTRDGTTPASVYTTLHNRHPDCLICPEQHFSDKYFNPNLGINDPFAQYLKVTAPYAELRRAQYDHNGSSFLLSSDEASTVGHGFFLVNTASGNGFSATQLFSDNHALLVQAVSQGDILMFEAWYNSEETPLIGPIYQAAGVPGF